MADPPRMTGVYDTPDTIPSPDAGKPPTAGAADHGAPRTASSGVARMTPSWVWIAAAIVVLAILGLVFL